MAVQYLGDNGPDGICMGLTSSEKIGFFATTPCDQPASSNQAAVSTSITATATTTNIETTVAALIVQITQMRTDLVELGLIKGAA